jgi:hypothetical protein
VYTPQLIASRAKPRALLLGLAHDLHDLGVARIAGAPRCSIVRADFAVDSADITVEPDVLVI